MLAFALAACNGAKSRPETGDERVTGLPTPAPAPGTVSATATLDQFAKVDNGYRCRVVTLSNVVRGSNVPTDLRTPFVAFVAEGVLKSITQGDKMPDLSSSLTVEVILQTELLLGGDRSWSVVQVR